MARLRSLFGARALPLLVPPWNRIAPEFLPLLPLHGIAGLSVTPSRGRREVPAGLAMADVHVDVVAWRDDRGFVGEAAALGGLVGWLRAARLADPATATPIGVLTHHLVMDLATAAFLDRLLAVTRAHPAVRWAAPAELLQ